MTRTLSPTEIQSRSVDIEPLGVVDIGSNSVRLVIYRRAAYHAVPVFNERVLCGIGRGLSKSGRLNEDGVTRAMAALARFHTLSDAMGVKRFLMVATAAVRDADNGRDFVAQASEICAAPVRVLSGQEEADLSAQGVLFGIPDANGVMGDLGGGSLELAELHDAKTHRAVTLPVGPLRLMDAFDKDIPALRKDLDRRFNEVEWLSEMKGRPLYAVGGIWRAFAKLHMAEHGYPLKVLHQYEMKASEVIELAAMLAGQSKKSLEAIRNLARRRVETLPYGSAVLERLLIAGKFGSVVVSAYGLREGLVFEEMRKAPRTRHPLLEGAVDWALTRSRSPALISELDPWLNQLFDQDTDVQARLRQAGCLLSDIAWRSHPDYRAGDGFSTVLTAPFPGLSHHERVFLALVLWHRHGGGILSEDKAAMAALLSDKEQRRAERLGLALRLAYKLCGAAPDILPQTRLVRNNGELSLDLPGEMASLAGEGVDRRLRALAASLQLTARPSLYLENGNGNGK